MDNPQTNQTMMKNYIIQNVGGANSAKFKRHYGTMIHMHKLSLLILLETRMADHTKLVDELGYNSKIQFPGTGSSEGIVVMQDNIVLNINHIAIYP